MCIGVAIVAVVGEVVAQVVTVVARTGLGLSESGGHQTKDDSSLHRKKYKIVIELNCQLTVLIIVTVSAGGLS